MAETLTDIPEYEGLYAITTSGRVWSYPKEGKHQGKWLRPGKSQDGYQVVVLTKDKNRVTWKVHTLVLTTYVGSAEGKEAHHKNFDRADNRLENLCWISHASNMLFSTKAGKFKKPGSQHPKAVFTEDLVSYIRNQVARGVPQVELARAFGVTSSAIWLIVHKWNWSHV